MEPANLLRITSLDEGWSDKDIVMLHACFQLLEDCVEVESLFENADWEQNEEFIRARIELQELYKWWKGRKARATKDDLDALERSNYQEDTQRLIRLIEWRHMLWA